MRWNHRACCPLRAARKHLTHTYPQLCSSASSPKALGGCTDWMAKKVSQFLRQGQACLACSHSSAPWVQALSWAGGPAAPRLRNHSRAPVFSMPHCPLCHLSAKVPDVRTERGLHEKPSASWPAENWSVHPQDNSPCVTT